MNYRPKFLLIKILAIFCLLGMVFFHPTTVSANIGVSRLEWVADSINLGLFSFDQDTINQNKRLDGKDTLKRDDIYSKIQTNAEKNYATRKLYGLFFRNKDIELAGRVITKSDATEKFANFSGKRINSIQYTRLNAFGQSVFDSTLKPSTLIENTANKLHVQTARFKIKHTILFREGEPVNPVDFSESEQLLRNLDYIEDANILIETAEDTSSVNVLVITKDAWSIGIDYRYSNKYSSQLQVYDKNLGGLGLLLNGYFFYDSRKPTILGRKYELSMSNIGGTFIDGDIWERRGQGYETYAFSVKRDFYASKTHYAGGIGIVKSHEPYSFKTIDTTQEVGYLGYDYWIGRSIRVSRKDISKSPHNFVLSFRYVSKYFSERPDVSINTNYPFHNKEYYLVGLSLTKQNYYKANFIYSFGSTEDIPTGFKVHFTSGIEKGEFLNRYYFGNELSSAEVGPWGYLFISNRFGGFLSSKNEVQQCTANVRLHYFSNLFKLGNSDIRQFVKVDFTRGIGRFVGEGETIFLDENNGVRGLTSRAMFGTTRLVVNIETVAFSPLYVYGFRFAFFTFYDFGDIGSADDYLFGDQSFAGFGLGVRIRNENLVLNTFQFRLGYYPKLPENPDVSYWLITGQQRTRIEGFRATKPEIVPFE